MSAAADAGPGDARRRLLLAVLVVAGATLAAWGWVLVLPLATGADVWPILAQARRALSDPSVLLRERYLEGLWDGARFWRPGLVGFAAIEWAAFGEAAAGYHAVRLVLAAAVALLVGTLATRRGGRPAVAFGIAALAVLWHPLRVETIPAVARDADSLFNLALALTVFWLAGAREARSAGPLVAGALAALLAPLFKEPGLLAPVIGFAVLEPWRHRDPRRGRAIAGAAVLGAGLAVHVAWRLALLGTLGGYEQTWVDLTRREALWASFLALCDHQAFGLWPLVLAAAGLALVFAGLGAEDSPAPAAGAGWRRIRLGAWIWIAGMLAAIVMSSRFRSRYVEAALVPLALLAGGWIAALAARAARRGPGAWRLAAAVAASVAVALAVLPGSPLVWRYPQWTEAARIGERVLGEVARLAGEAPADGAAVTSRLGRVSLAARRLPDDGGLELALSPFPYKVAEPEGPRTGSITTVVIMGQQTLEGFAEMRALPRPLLVRRGPPALDLRLADLEPAVSPPVRGSAPAASSPSPRPAPGTPAPRPGAAPAPR
ncbi:MAG: hypothetical protein D6738_10990 [Acidobacteria bacterium]|nr:MAG: hypothetical protein D6738_10990 [Acidobacteriota bacterium]